MSAFRSDFDGTKYMSFLIKDDELLDKYNEIWEKVRTNIKNAFDSEPVYNKKYLETKIKSCNEKINANFHNNKQTKIRFSMHLLIKNFDWFCFCRRQKLLFSSINRRI